MDSGPAHMRDQLPVPIEPGAGESSGSYCLRSVASHGLNMHWLRRIARLSYLAHPTASHEQEISHLVQAPREWLRAALPLTVQGPGSGWWYQGHRLRAQSYLRFRWPQVCAACLHSRGYCLALWDFSLITSCSKHGESLIDYCLACKRPLSWDRPAVDICACGRPIRGVGQPSKSSSLGALESLIEAHVLGRPPTRDSLVSAGLPDFLADMSTDGVMSVVHAFGEQEAPLERGTPSVMTRMRAAADWRAVVRRADARLRQLAIEPGSSAVLGPLVNESILKRLDEGALTPADRQVSRLVTAALFGKAACARAQALVNGQRELFA